MKKYNGGNWTDGNGRVDYQYKIVDGNECVYCGEEAEVYDHVPPIACYPASGLKYPACNRCNSFLHSFVSGNINERKKVLIKQYKKKYRKILKMPEWDEHEMEEVDSSLKAFILSGLAQKETIYRKIERLNTHYETMQR